VAEGRSASGFMLNAVEEGSIEQLVTNIEAITARTKPLASLRL
jgi:hypothetical protein